MRTIGQFFSNLSIGKTLLLMISPILTVLVSMKIALFGLLVLIFIDLLTGIRKNHFIKKIRFNLFKHEFWASIKSYLLRQTWRKTYEYGIGILVIVIFETLILGATPIEVYDKNFTIGELSVLIASAIEVWSIFENMEKVSGYNLLKRIRDLLPEPLAKLFGKKKDETSQDI